MSYARHGRRLGVCFLAILSLMGIMAVGAEGEVFVNGKKLTSQETGTGSAHTTGIFLVPSKGIEIECTGYTIDEAVILTTGKSHGRILISNCTTFLKGVEAKSCKPSEPVTASGKGEPILHNGSTYVLGLPPEEAKPFARVDFPVSCALPDTNIGGSAVAECLTSNLESGKNLCELELVTHLAKQAPEALFPEHQLTYGVNTAVIDGVAATKLNGANSGQPFSGVI